MKTEELNALMGGLKDASSGDFQLLAYEQLLSSEVSDVDSYKAKMEKNLEALKSKVAELEQLNSIGEEGMKALQEEKKAAEKELKDAEDELDEIIQQLEEVREENRELDRKMAKLREGLAQLKAKLKLQDDLMRTAQMLEKDFDAKKSECARVTRDLEELGKRNEDKLPRLRLLKNNTERISKAKETVTEVQTFLEDVWERIREERTDDRLVMEN